MGRLESNASDQGILTISELSPEMLPFTGLNIVWAKVHAQILTKERRCLNPFQF